MTQDKEFETTDTVVNIILIVALLLYSANAFITGEFFIPGKYGRGVSLTGTQMIFMTIAIVFAILNALFEIKLLRTKNKDRHLLKKKSKTTKIIAWVFFIFAIVLNILNSY